MRSLRVSSGSSPWSEANAAMRSAANRATVAYDVGDGAAHVEVSRAPKHLVGHLEDVGIGRSRPAGGYDGSVACFCTFGRQVRLSDPGRVVAKLVCRFDLVEEVAEHLRFAGGHAVDGRLTRC